jgi:predicted GH43/DUF377 family glycosyl hydrolase
MRTDDRHHRRPLKSKVTFAIIFLELLCLTMLSMEMGFGQKDWIKHPGNPVLPKSEDGWDSGNIHAAAVLKEGETYRMWYSATNYTHSGIGLALSPNGVDWDKYPGNPVILDGPEEYDVNLIFGPTVVRDGEGYRMWYTGSDSDSIWTVNLATSPDGISWTKHPENPVLRPSEWYDAERAGDPWVVRDDGVYRMWYTCQNRPMNITYAIAYATSQDGVNWIKHPQNPVLLAGEEGPDSNSVRDPCVVRSTSGYEMWYRGIGVADWTVCYATSDDGVNWVRYDENPVLWGEPGAWDARIWFPRVLDEAGLRSMWYTSADANEIGYAHMPIAQGCIVPFALAAVLALYVRNRESSR